MVYYRHTHTRSNSSSALSFTSSTASAGGASFSSSDDPSGVSSYPSSLLVTAKNIFESVYRCDSAAVVDGASSCGSVANQALYQGVEVILRTTTCNNYNGDNIKDSVKDSVASKPLFEFQCFCDDDDFIVNEEYEQKNTIMLKKKLGQHVRGMSTSSYNSNNSGEDRNERNPSAPSVNDVRNSAVEEEDISESAVSRRRSKWTAHTKSFYSKIHSPAQRVVTTLSDVTTTTSFTTTTPTNNNNASQKRIPIELSSSINTGDKTKTTVPTSLRWMSRHRVMPAAPEQ